MGSIRESAYFSFRGVRNNLSLFSGAQTPYHVNVKYPGLFKGDG